MRSQGNENNVHTPFLNRLKVLYSAKSNRMENFKAIVKVLYITRVSAQCWKVALHTVK